MAKNHLRGVNDIPSRMSRPRGNSGRSQNATLLARLEQQKSLLEKQLQVWVKQKTVTEERLRIVATQIRSAQQALKLTRPAAATASRGAIGLRSGTVAKRATALEFAF